MKQPEIVCGQSDTQSGPTVALTFSSCTWEFFKWSNLTLKWSPNVMKFFWIISSTVNEMGIILYSLLGVIPSLEPGFTIWEQIIISLGDSARFMLLESHCPGLGPRKSTDKIVMKIKVSLYCLIIWVLGWWETFCEHGEAVAVAGACCGLG